MKSNTTTALLMLFALTIALFGCGNEGKVATSNAPTATIIIFGELKFA
jgi:hypothetical protein